MEPVTPSGEHLPDFEHPPVVETVLGLEFEPLPGWDIRHFGLYWQQIQNEYPHFQVQPPLSPSEQRTGATEVAENLLVTFLGVSGPKVRAWFIDPAEVRLLQVQDDRFLQNWRKISDDEAYPHYDESLRPAFVRQWDRFRAFLATYNIEPPRVKRWEVTYVNHLVRGREWDNFQDLGRVFSLWKSTSDGFLPAADTARLVTRYPIPDGAGHLTVTVQPSRREGDGKEVLQITLTAAGGVQSSELSEILRCLDLGRLWVVRGFTDFTTPEMHHLWGKRERA